MRYTLEMVADRLEIEDLITDYAAAIDTGAIDKLDAIFTPDAQIDYSAMGGAKGSYPEVKAFLQKALKGFRATQHFISNFEIRLDGDRATGKIMCLNPMELETGDKPAIPVFFLGLWYHDEYIKTAEGWRIAVRTESKSWTHNLPGFMKL
ncbi:MAG: nuclear transport factor 2 family protein [Pseudomonadales bacterium]